MSLREILIVSNYILLTSTSDRQCLHFQRDESSVCLFGHRLKTVRVSFLPKLPMGAYEQMPYEEISESDYKERMKGLAPVDFTESALNSRDDTELNANNGANGPDAFCDGDKCTI